MLNKANLYLSKKKKVDSLTYLTKYHRKSAILLSNFYENVSKKLYENVREV